MIHIKLAKQRSAGHLAKRLYNRWTKYLLEWRSRDTRRRQRHTHRRGGGMKVLWQSLDWIRIEQT